MSSKRKGFTIVELVIVVAVVAILAAVLVPTFSGLVDKANESKALQQANSDYKAYLIDRAAELTGDEQFYWTDGTYTFCTQSGVFAKCECEETGADLHKGFVNVNSDARSYFMHLSFDDVEICFKNLTNKKYSSLYDEPFFAWLKSMHDTYGAKFSLYAYNDILNSVPNTHAAEFAAASDWLKIGLHAANSESNFKNTTYEQGKATWNQFVANVQRITGTEACIDRMPRLHLFAGSEEALRGMADANCGAIGFLSADDSRISYYFDSDTAQYLYTNDHITDNANSLIFVATDLRIDWFLSDFSSGNEYRNPTNSTVYNELAERYTSSEFADSISSYILFGHEWQFYKNGAITTEGKKFFDDACRFATEKGIAFDYSQNRTFSKTSYDIYADAEGTTTKFSGEKLKIVESLDQVSYISGYSINGGGLTYTATAARAVSKSEVLKVDENMRVLSLDDSKLSIGSNLQYTVYQFSDAPLNSSTFANNTGAGTWTQKDITLLDSTKYIMIVFKNNAGAEFTDSDLALLNTCVTFRAKEMESATYQGKGLGIVTSIEQMTFVSGYTLNGGANGDFISTSGRAACISAVLAVNGGETLSFISNLEELFGTTNLSFAVLEFSDSTMSSTTLSNSSNQNACGQAWLTGAHTLQSNTKYVLIALKNGDGTTNFTADQLVKLKNCLVLSA